MKIAFFLGSVDISGGSYVIYQHALHCHRQGHNVTIVAQFSYQPHQLVWHPATSELRILHIDDLPADESFDLAIATWWRTATELHRLSAHQYAYFVQSIESKFYSEAPLCNLVDSTYRLPLPGITEATWIKRYLSDRYGHDYHLVLNGIRKDLYNTDSRPEPLPDGKIRVLVEGPFGVSFKNVGRTLKLLRKAAPDEIWLLTSSDVPWYPGVDKVFSRVPIDEVAKVYRACDAIVKLSYVEGMFGPPLEMFHCGGTAIVYAVSGYDEYIVHNENAVVAAKDDEQAVIDAIRQFKREPERLAALKRGALSTASRWPDWHQSSTQFLAALESIMAMPPVDRTQIAALNKTAMDEYARDEGVRLRKRPWIKMRYRIDAVIAKLPPRLVRKMRLASYIFEGFR